MIIPVKFHRHTVSWVFFVCAESIVASWIAFPPNSCPPGISEYDFIYEQDVYRVHSVKNLRMKSSWRQVGPKPNDWYLNKRKERQIQIGHTQKGYHVKKETDLILIHSVFILPFVISTTKNEHIHDLS